MHILVCIDGEPHTQTAIERAIEIALAEAAEITALHVVDPWLKGFYNEIYAQGRMEYLEYVDERLNENAAKACGEFEALCLAEGLETRFRIRHGEPLEEILSVARETAPDLLIVGRKPLNAWGRFRSANLPARLKKALGRETAVLTVEASDPVAAS